jgi:hypothetical protein
LISGEVKPTADAIVSLREALAVASKAFGRSKAPTVTKSGLRGQMREIVKKYFSVNRPEIRGVGVDENLLLPLDGLMQDLLSYSNARTTRTIYLRTFKKVERVLNGIDVAGLTSKPLTSQPSETQIGAKEKAIVDTLKSISAAAAQSFEQGLADLGDINRTSWRGTAAEFREALRETLDGLAPDEAVKAQHGFLLEKNCSGPTMKQKVVFILKNREVGSKSIDTAKANVNLIEEKTGAFVRSVYDRTSASTHGVASRAEVVSIKDHVSLVLSELLQVQA